MKPVEIFHIGPQKSGTTWVYECLREHPQVAVPPVDSIHYYDMFHHRGPEWYAGHFADANEGQLRIDPTPSYLRSPYAAARIAADSPEAKIVLCLRHPIDRAFSHYWHEKKKRRFDFRFEEILENYDLWSNWLESGFYSRMIGRYLDHFPRERLLCQRFDELRADAPAFLDQLLVFLGVDRDFEPSVLHKRVNPAKAPEAPGKIGARNALESVGLLGTAVKVKGVLRSAGIVKDQDLAAQTDKIETLADVSGKVRAELQVACAPEIDELERLLGDDFSSWRRDG